VLTEARYGYRLNDAKMVDSMVYDGLWDSFNQMHMGLTAEICAQRHNVTREQADELSVLSHARRSGDLIWQVREGDRA